MSESYGMMVGCENAIKWVQNLKGVKEDNKNRVVNRMRYEFAKDIPVKPKFYKGKYGHKYDSYACGNCGSGLPEAWWQFCPNCGFRIGDKHEWNSNRNITS